MASRSSATTTRTYQRGSAVRVIGTPHVLTVTDYRMSWDVTLYEVSGAQGIVGRYTADQLEPATLPPNVATDGHQWRYVACPSCGGELTRYYRDHNPKGPSTYCRCLSCGAHIGYSHDVDAAIRRELAVAS